jgi:hypothetical protein
MTAKTFTVTWQTRGVGAKVWRTAFATMADRRSSDAKNGFWREQYNTMADRITTKGGLEEFIIYVRLIAGNKRNGWGPKEV